MKAKATPFDALLGLKRCRLPKSRSVTVVVAGAKVDDLRQIDRKVVDAERDDQALAEARRLRKLAERARAAARYQADKLDPVKMAKRKAWIEANPEKVAEYRRRNRERNRERNRQQAADWARRSYANNPEKHRARSRAWYERNREKVLAAAKAKAKAKRDAARQARQEAEGAQS